MAPLVLCYHAVSSTWEHRLSIHPQLLVRQVRALSRFRRLRISFDDAFRNAATVFPDLERLGFPITVFICTALARNGTPLSIPELAGDDPDELATMGWDELRSLADRGIGIQSHGVSHAHLTQVSDDELRAELVDSKAEIEDAFPLRIGGIRLGVLDLYRRHTPARALLMTTPLHRFAT